MDNLDSLCPVVTYQSVYTYITLVTHTRIKLCLDVAYMYLWLLVLCVYEQNKKTVCYTPQVHVGSLSH